MSATSLASSPRRHLVAAVTAVLTLSAVAVGIAAPDSAGAAAPVSAGIDSRPQLADLIEQVKPAVVNISVTKRAAPVRQLGARPQFGPRGAPMDEFFERFFGQRGQGPDRSERPGGQAVGSGFIVDAEGYVVTNHHVVSDADAVAVTLQDGTRFEAEIVGVDQKTDLALLRIEADADLPYATFGASEEARVGDWVVAIGNPFGLGGTATAGIISARGRDLRAGPYDDFIQIDAPINQGNSGGPVFDTNGEVIGVNTLIYSPNGGNVGIGFAIPANQVETVVAALRDNGSVSRGWLGVQIQTVTDDIADSLELDEARGAVISDVMPGSPADEGGLRIGDVVLDFDGQPVEDARGLSRAVAGAFDGDRARIRVWRDGEPETLSVRVGSGEQERAAAEDAGEAQAAELGLALAPLNDEMRQRFRMEDDAQGALVMRVEPGSRAAREGIRAGDVITRVNRRDVDSPGALAAEVKKAKKADRDSVLMLVRRGGGQRFVSVDLG